MVKLEFLDVICEALCAGEDEKNIFIIKNNDFNNVEIVESETLMGILYDKEDKFINANLETEDHKIHCNFKNNENILIHIM